MTISLSNESKNETSLSYESKAYHDDTWDEANYTWDDAGTSTWDVQKARITKETKNSASLTLENKS